MSGHSKFANIKHKKEKNDAAKGKIFTIIGREIAVAVKEGGADPANNSRLRDVIAKAKANNMPNDTIIVETLTDNKNRTAANVRNAFTKGGGNVGTPGCVSYMFDEKGQILIDKEEYSADPDEFMMTVIDAGAEDFVDNDDSFEIITAPDMFSEVREKLEKLGVPMAEAEVKMIPQNYVTLTSEDDIKKINKIFDLLDAEDDVQNVFHNWDE